MQQRVKVLIADGLAPEGVQVLKSKSSIELLYHDALDRKELKELIPQIEILVVRSRTQVDKDLIEGGRNLRLVIRAGIGLDNIDVAAATDLGVVVMNAPTGNIVTTAEHALAMIFAVSRHIPQADATLRKGKWEKKKFQGNELRGKTLGLLGLGNIGKAVAERAHGLGMKVVGHDPYLSAEAAAKHRVSLLPMDEVLKQADYLSLHVPLNPSTKHLIGREAIAKMKPDAYVINCARGGILDEAALIEALDAGKLTGAALDVFETEPLPPTHPLIGRADVVLTPHLGASTDEAQTQVGLEVAEEITAYLDKGVFKNAINVPNISADQMEILRPYLRLCERIGAFAGQVAPNENVKRLRIHYEGAIGSHQPEVLTLSLLKGFLTPLLSTPVNFVNVKKLLRERGIKVEESFEEECDDFSSLVRITVEGKETLTVAGTLFGKDEPRIVRIDDYAIDAIPSGYMLFTKNVDQPGVIGAMGSILGTSGINIARMHLGRNQEKSQAIALISVDSALPENTLAAMRGIQGMLSVKQVRL